MSSIVEVQATGSREEVREALGRVRDRLGSWVVVWCPPLWNAEAKGADLRGETFRIELPADRLVDAQDQVQRAIDALGLSAVLAHGDLDWRTLGSV